MIDYTRRGQRVQLRYPLRTAFHSFRGDEIGRILSEIENGIGGVLIEVEWEFGQSPIFEHEVIFLDLIKKEEHHS